MYSEGIDSEGEEKRRFGWQVIGSDMVCMLATALWGAWKKHNFETAYTTLDKLLVETSSEWFVDGERRGNSPLSLLLKF